MTPLPETRRSIFAMMLQDLVPIMGSLEASANATLLVGLAGKYFWKVDAVQFKLMRLQAGTNSLFDHRGITDARAFTGAVPAYNF